MGIIVKMNQASGYPTESLRFHFIYLSPPPPFRIVYSVLTESWANGIKLHCFHGQLEGSSKKKLAPFSCAQMYE